MVETDNYFNQNIFNKKNLRQQFCLQMLLRIICLKKKPLDMPAFDEHFPPVIYEEPSVSHEDLHLLCQADPADLVLPGCPSDLLVNTPGDLGGVAYTYISCN